MKNRSRYQTIMQTAGYESDNDICEISDVDGIGKLEEAYKLNLGWLYK